MQQESSAGLRDDLTAIRVAVEELARRMGAMEARLAGVEGRLDSMEARLLRLEDRQFQTILAVLGTFAALFAAILASLLG